MNVHGIAFFNEFMAILSSSLTTGNKEKIAIESGILLKYPCEFWNVYLDLRVLRRGEKKELNSSEAIMQFEYFFGIYC